jgi:hypothetical protein
MKMSDHNSKVKFEALIYNKPGIKEDGSRKIPGLVSDISTVTLHAYKHFFRHLFFRLAFSI